MGVMMSRAESAFRLLRLAAKPGVGLEDVVALQVAMRSMVKRHFDFARNRARKAAARMGERVEIPKVIGDRLETLAAHLEGGLNSGSVEHTTSAAVIDPPMGAGAEAPEARVERAWELSEGFVPEAVALPKEGGGA